MRPTRSFLARRGAAAGLVLALAGLATSCGDASAPATSAASVPVVVHASEVPPLHPSIDALPRGVVTIVTDDAAHRVPVLIASEPAELQHGLMEVTGLPAGVGMYFLFDTDRTSGFWMKGTLVPLSIAYVAADGTIVDLLEMTPCREDPCPGYPPRAPYRNTLEMAGGWFDEQGVEIGDRLLLDR